jgi:Protein of unknown function with PCYCGC motif
MDRMLSQSRRRFLGACGALVTAAIAPGVLEAAIPKHRHGSSPHPTPRPGITGVNVATHEQLADKPQFIELFDSVRNVPEVIDGIRCNCGCADNKGFYSLLTCYEGKDAMAKGCTVCQGQGRLATRLHKLGKSLAEIRAAVDAKFG